MPYELVIEPDVLRLTLTGEVTRADVDAFLAEIAVLEQRPAVTPHRLIDFTGVTAAGFETDLIRDAAARRKLVRLKNAVRTAIIAARPVHLGFARMFQLLSQNPQVTIEVFGTEAEAREWLGPP